MYILKGICRIFVSMRAMSHSLVRSAGSYGFNEFSYGFNEFYEREELATNLMHSLLNPC